MHEKGWLPRQLALIPAEAGRSRLFRVSNLHHGRVVRTPAARCGRADIASELTDGSDAEIKQAIACYVGERIVTVVVDWTNRPRVFGL